MNDRFEVTRTIPAEASVIFAVLRDPKGHVAIDASGMLMSASGSPAGAVGDTFEVNMHRDALGDFPLGRYEVTVRITAYDQDAEIAWTVGNDEMVDVPIGHIYGYRLRPVKGGTEVTSYYDWSSINPIWRDRELPFGTVRWPVIPEASLRATLGILERTVVNG